MPDSFRDQPFRTLRVPASSANLGPGFDALGLALNIYLTCRFRRSEDLAIRVSGLDADQIPTDSRNLIVEIAQRVAGISAMPFELEIENDIPIGKGLGSSAAAVTAGVVIGAEIAELGWGRARVLDEAARIEGHPDNVAACVLGGVVAAAMVAGAGQDESRQRVSQGCLAARAVRLAWPEQFRVAALVPGFAVATSEARLALPDRYSREDAIFNLQRSTLLVAALAAGAPDAFPWALEDRFHQAYRFALVPGLEEVTTLRAPGLLGCTLSGAGPSILVFYERGQEQAVELAREVFSRHSLISGPGPAAESAAGAVEIRWTEVDASGYRIERA